MPVRKNPKMTELHESVEKLDISPAERRALRRYLDIAYDYGRQDGREDGGSEVRKKVLEALDL